MKIERVDDKTVKCFITNEELEEFEIDYKDFVMQNEKAKVVVREIMEIATEEVGYTPPPIAFDLQIMMVPNQGIVLTLSEKSAVSEPTEDMPEDSPEYLKKCFQELLKYAESKEKKAKEEQAQATEAAKKFSKDKVELPESLAYSFNSMRDAMEYAASLPANLRVESALYKLQNAYYLCICRGAASYKRYSKACIQATDYGRLCAWDEKRLSYIREHGECLIPEKAIKKLRLN